MLPLGERNADVDYFKYINDPSGLGYVFASRLSMAQYINGTPLLENENQVFTLFPKLPWEIQLMIFDLVQLHPRILSIRRAFRPSLHTSCLVYSPFVENFEYGKLGRRFGNFRSHYRQLKDDIDTRGMAAALSRLQKLQYPWTQFRRDDSKVKSDEANDLKNLVVQPTIAYFNPRLDNITFQNTVELKLFTSRSGSSMDITDLEQHVRHLTIRETKADAMKSGLIDALSRFLLLETPKPTETSLGDSIPKLRFLTTRFLLFPTMEYKLIVLRYTKQVWVPELWSEFHIFVDAIAKWRKHPL
jgi:hypothetical protein